MIGLDIKRRLVGGLLLALALWTVGHRAAVAAFDLNPWKFFGWAMYCRPPASIGLEITWPEAKPGEPRLEIDAPPDWSHRVEVFRFWRMHAGRLARPDSLARVLLQRNPSVPEIEIIVTHTVLDWRTAKMRSRDYSFSYRRP